MSGFRFGLELAGDHSTRPAGSTQPRRRGRLAKLSETQLCCLRVPGLSFVDRRLTMNGK
jgi:hypothetical protein